MPNNNSFPLVITKRVKANPLLQEKTTQPTNQQQVVTPDRGYDGLSKVNISGVSLQEKSVEPTNAQQIITPDNGYVGLSKVTVAAGGNDAELKKAISGIGEANIENLDVTAIAAYAFSKNTNLKSISSETVISIGQYAFSETNMVSASFPKATTLGMGAFANSKNIKSICLYVTQLPNSCFTGCVALETVNLPNVVTIGQNTFNICRSLTEFKSLTLTNIGFQSFLGCSKLKVFDAPLTYCEAYAFKGCTILDTVILRGNSVCTLGGTTSFTDTAIANGNGFIYVPDDLVDSYKADAKWSTFAAQIKGLSELPTE